MRYPISLGLLACTMLLCSCLNEGSALLGPEASDAESTDPLLARSANDIRIVKPASGEVLRAGAAFDVVVWQEVREEIPEAYAMLQFATADGEWTDLGSAMPWSAQSRQWVIRGVKLDGLGAVTMRLAIFESPRSTPLLESAYALLHCLESPTTQIAASE